VYFIGDTMSTSPLCINVKGKCQCYNINCNYCAHVESVLVRLVTIGLGASIPIFVGERWLANFNASCSHPLENDSLMVLRPQMDAMYRCMVYTMDDGITLRRQTIINDWYYCVVRGITTKLVWKSKLSSRRATIVVSYKVVTCKRFVNLMINT